MIFAAALVFFIVFGLATKLYFSISLDLNSDMAGIGLISMEIARHGNFLLSGYYLPADDTFIFTELPFQLIPQVLTNYDPLTLKLVSFAIFGLAVAALSYVVFLVSGETLNALLFAALAANISPAGYSFFAMPTTHIATIAFLGVMFIILLYIGKRAATGEKKRKKARTDPIQWPLVAGLGALTLLSVLSDTIILTWFIVPFVLAYLLFSKKSPGMNVAVGAMAAISALAYIFKTNFVREWVSQSFVKLDTANIVSVTFPLSLKSLGILIDPGLYRALDGLKGFGIMDAISVAVLAALMLYALKNAAKDKRSRFFYGILLFSGLIMFASFLAMSLVKDLSQARYFTFTALTAFMVVGVSCRKGDRIYTALALAFLLISAIYGFAQVSAQWGYQPNAQEYGLIAFLKENNLTYGYGSALTSNTYTYLSSEAVTIRPVLFYRDGLRPNVWLACERWYRDPPDEAFILVDNSTLDANGRQVIGSLAEALNASEPLHYGKYDIYPTNRKAFGA
jgi:hypothetical protein